MKQWTPEQIHRHKRYIQNDEERLAEWELRLIQHEKEVRTCQAMVKQYRESVAANRLMLEARGGEMV